MVTEMTQVLGDFLCTVDFHVAGGIIPVGASPFNDRKIGYITGGKFEGPRLSGEVLPGGGNWSPCSMGIILLPP